MQAITYFNQAIELEKEGEDGSCHLSLLCGPFEFAQLNAVIDVNHPYHYLVEEGERTLRSVEARR